MTGRSLPASTGTASRTTDRTSSRDPLPDERLDGPRLAVTSVVRDAVPALAGSEHSVVAVDGDRVVGVVDRNAVLRAIAGEGG